MKNNTICKVYGAGSVQMNMLDGMVRTLCDVRHVLGLKKNLISLSYLDKNGYRISYDGGLLVMMKGKVNESLCALDGSTISRLVNVYTNTMSDQETKLWYLRLSHMGKRGMHELCKKGLFDG